MKIFRKVRDFIYIKPLMWLSNKLAMSTTSKYKFYERYIRWQMSDSVEYMLYGDKSWVKGFRIMWDNHIVLLLLILATISGTYVYKLGSYSRDGEIIALMASNELKYNNIESLNLELDNKSKDILSSVVTIDSLLEFRNTREWLEYKIYTETEMDDFYLNMSRASDDILFLMANQADKYDIPYSIYFRLIDVESGYKFQGNKSESGAFGYMQIMPSTFNSYARKLNLSGGHTEVNDILVGSYMLYKNHNDWMNRGYDTHEAWEYSLAEYNAGEGKMQIKNDENRVIGWYVPSYTMKYISTIMKSYNKKYRS